MIFKYTKDTKTESFSKLSAISSWIRITCPLHPTGLPSRTIRKNDCCCTLKINQLCVDSSPSQLFWEWLHPFKITFWHQIPLLPCSPVFSLSQLNAKLCRGNIPIGHHLYQCHLPTIFFKNSDILVIKVNISNSINLCLERSALFLDCY